MSVEFRNVTYRYPGTESGVFDVSLEVESGELVTVIGPSGSGKSTLLNLLAGFLRPDGGRILVEGEDIGSLKPEQRDLGIVFQSYALFPHMTVGNNVAYPLKVRRIPRRERMDRARDALQRVGLATQFDRLPATLSGGQQQRVALARALVFEPKALLLDEPLSALDAALRGEVRDEITRVQRAANIATLHVTHDQEEALSMGTRVAVMFEGHLVQTDTPTVLYDRPRTAQVAAFVGNTNLFRGKIVERGSIEIDIGRLIADTSGFAPGDDIVAMVRLENVLPHHDESAHSPMPNMFVGEVSEDRFLGAVRRYDLAVRGGTIKGETTSRDSIGRVSIPPEAIRLLHAE